MITTAQKQAARDERNAALDAEVLRYVAHYRVPVDEKRLARNMDLGVPQLRHSLNRLLRSGRLVQAADSHGPYYTVVAS